jgi:hypothetical protein
LVRLYRPTLHEQETKALLMMPRHPVVAAVFLGLEVCQVLDTGAV